MKTLFFGKDPQNLFNFYYNRHILNVETTESKYWLHSQRVCAKEVI